MCRGKSTVLLYILRWQLLSKKNILDFHVRRPPVCREIPSCGLWEAFYAVYSTRRTSFIYRDAALPYLQCAQFFTSQAPALRTTEPKTYTKLRKVLYYKSQQVFKAPMLRHVALVSRETAVRSSWILLWIRRKQRAQNKVHGVQNQQQRKSLFWYQPKAKWCSINKCALSVMSRIQFKN